jgi:hypothetical protein
MYLKASGESRFVATSSCLKWRFLSSNFGPTGFPIVHLLERDPIRSSSIHNLKVAIHRRIHRGDHWNYLDHSRSLTWFDQNAMRNPSPERRYSSKTAVCRADGMVSMIQLQPHVILSPREER